MAGLLGGLSALKQATALEQKLGEELQSKIQNNTGENYGVFQVVSFKDQVVAGKNFFIKIFIGGSNNCIHVRIYQSFNGEASLTSVQCGKTFLDPIEYFE